MGNHEEAYSSASHPNARCERIRLGLGVLDIGLSMLRQSSS